MVLEAVKFPQCGSIDVIKHGKRRMKSSVICVKIESSRLIHLSEIIRQ